MDASTRSLRLAILAGVTLALALLLTACTDEPTEIIAVSEETSADQPAADQPAADEPAADEPAADLPEDETVTDEPVNDPTPGDRWQRTVTRSDLIQTEVGSPLEVIADPSDDRSILVRYEGAAEPCAGVDVVVAESADTIEVQLLVGLDPNVAAMSCVAGVFDYEVAVSLAEPVGDRQIVVAGA